MPAEVKNSVFSGNTQLGAGNEILEKTLQKNGHFGRFFYVFVNAPLQTPSPLNGQNPLSVK